MQVRFTETFYEVTPFGHSEPKYLESGVYELNEDTQRHVDIGRAVLVKTTGESEERRQTSKAVKAVHSRSEVGAIGGS